MNKLPKRLDRTTIYESNWINLYTDRVEMPSGKIIEKYHIYDIHKEGVVAYIENKKGEVCMIKSLRYSTQKVEWELPAGSIEKGETILEAAKREVMEETGYLVDNIKLTYSFNPHGGMSNYVVHVVSGTLNEALRQKEFDTDEVGEVCWLSKAEIEVLIQKNEIMGAPSLMALLLQEKFFSISKK